MNPTRPISRRPRGSHTGFSLIELMIGLTIGLVLLTVMATVFDRTSGGRSDLDRVSRLVENSRFAVEVIGDDIRHAGFYGTFLPPSDTVFTDTSPCAWDVADLNSLGWQPTPIAPRLPAQLVGWDDPVAGDPALGCLPDRLPGSDVIVHAPGQRRDDCRSSGRRSQYLCPGVAVHQRSGAIAGIKFGRAVHATNGGM